MRKFPISRFVDAAIIVLVMVMMMGVYNEITKLGDTGKVERIDEIYDSKYNYTTESAPQATQLNTQITMDLVYESSKTISTLMRLVVTLITMLVLLIGYIALKLVFFRQPRRVEVIETKSEHLNG